MAQRSWRLNAILAAFAFLILAPTISLSAYVAWRSAKQAQVVAQAQIVEQTSVYLRALDLFSQNVLRVLDTIDVMTEDSDGYARLERRMRALTPRLASGFSVRDATGQQLINTLAPEGASLPVSRAIPVLEGDRQIRVKGEPAHIGVFKGTVSDQYFVAISAPLRMAGYTDLIMTIALNAADVRERIIGEVPPGWVVSVVDQNGTVIARSADHDRFVGQQATRDMREAMARASQGTLRTRTLTGALVFAAFSTSKVSGWTVVASAPVATIEKTSREFGRALALMIALALALSLIAGFEFWRRLSRAINGLRLSAANLVAETSIAAGRTGVAEIDQVQTAMAEASHTLRERTEHQKQLLREMNHRVKNKLAISRTMMMGTLDAHDVPRAVKDMVDSRILALSAAHEVSTSNEWRRVRLDALVRAIAEKMDAEVVASGPEVKLADRAVVPLGQAFHEAFLLLGDASRVAWEVSADALTIELSGAGRPRGDAADHAFSLRIVRATIVRQFDGQLDATDTAMTWKLPLKSRLGEAVHISDRA